MSIRSATIGNYGSNDQQDNGQNEKNVKLKDVAMK